MTSTGRKSSCQQQLLEGFGQSRNTPTLLCTSHLATNPCPAHLAHLAPQFLSPASSEELKPF